MSLVDQILNLPAVSRYLDAEREKHRVAIAAAKELDAVFERDAARLTARMVLSGCWVGKQ
jgi:hypothetical protein